MEARGIAAAMNANHFGVKADQLEDINEHLNGTKPWATKKATQHVTFSSDCLCAFRSNSSRENRLIVGPKEIFSAVATASKTSL